MTLLWLAAKAGYWRLHPRGNPQLRAVRNKKGDCMLAAWMKLVLDTSMLTLESQQVMALRFFKLTLGGSAAPREVSRMVTEKIVATTEAAAKVATGSTASSVVKGYRKKVQANRRRLSR